MLPERLVPIGPTAGEDASAIASALTSFGQRARRDDWQALERFAQTNPTSAWRPSVLANLATLHVRSGAYSRALSLYRQVWEQTRGRTAPEERALADYVLGEWLEHSIKFGHVAAVKARLLELGDREVGGTASAKVRHAREGVWFLENLHHKALFSGPEALRNLLRTLRGEDTEEPTSLKQYMPTAAGTSAADLVRLAAAADLPLRAVARTSARAVLPVPSIVHLRTDHFSMVVARDQGGYVLRDPVLGGKVWIRADVLEDEASGLVLAPAVLSGASVGAWRDATAVEQAGAVGHCAPGMPGDDPLTCGPSPGMPSYCFHPVKAAVMITDTPVGYTPPRGPSVSFTLRYDHRDQRQPQVAEYGDVGPRWTFDWLSYVQDNFTSAYPPYTWTRVHLRGQSMEYYGGQDYLPYHWRSRAVLVKVSNDPVRYERRLPDGAVEVFELPDRGPTQYGRRIFLTQVIDPQGQTLTFTYDSQLRLVAVTDAIGQVSTVGYAHPSDPLKVTSVTDPFGRSATLGYDGQGRLAKVTDVIGLTSTFTYGTEDFIAAMTTPYGTTSFRHEPSPVNGERWVEATDPLGATERLEFRFWNSAGLPQTLPASEVPTGFGPLNVSMDDYNTLYWGPRAMATAPGQLASAVITSWVIGPDMNWSHGFSRNIPHSVKRPLESRIWYRYPGQSATPGRSAGIGTTPTEEARVLDDGSTQLRQSTVNDKGQVTSSTDPLGRRTTYTYAANGIDLLEVRQTTGSLNDLLVKFADHAGASQPQTIIDASGQATTLTYHSSGKPATRTNPKSETTSFTYDSLGRLVAVVRPIAGASTTYTYDDYGRVRTTANDNHVVTFDYDVFNRLTRVTYPDSSYEETVYDRLDAVRRRDRLGRWTYQTFDATRRLTATRDSAGRTIRQQWCVCGDLEAIVDAKGQRTSWLRDVQGRVTTEVRADGATAAAYTYDLSSRLKAVTDAKLQTTAYTYAADGALASLVFVNPQIPTASVSYTYDQDYARLSSMVDGVGTTTYAYRQVGQLGAMRLATIDGPFSNDTVAYAYDSLGRRVHRTVNSTANSLALIYDALGRVSSESNVLGEFTFGYDGATGRLASVVYPNGQTSSYTYGPASQDHRLQTIHHRYPGTATLSRFDYTYDIVGNIVTWQQQADSSSPVLATYRYDGADQLTREERTSTGVGPAILKRYAWTYDGVGNRLSEQIDDAVTGSAYDSRNQIVSRFGGGALRVVGMVNEPASVTVEGQPAMQSATGEFERPVSVVAGANTISIVATDSAGNAATAGYQVAVDAHTQGFEADANGNRLTDGSRTFEWDARNQLVAINSGAHRSEFSYDGAQRLVLQRELHNGAEESVTRLLWCQDVICEERSADGSVTRHLEALGQKTGELLHFFSKDHLGSVREVLDSGGTLVSRQAFDSWGRRSVTNGAEVTSVGFTGHRTHTPSGLALTHYRVYDPETARWISEDPVGLAAGPNTQAYVSNSPVTAVDPNGLVAVRVVVTDVRRHTEYMDLTKACGTTVAAGVTFGCAAMNVDARCNCVADGCNQWRPKISLDVRITVNVSGNPNANPAPDLVIREEAKHVFRALDVVEERIQAAEAVERMRFGSKFQCTAACMGWIGRTYYEFWNDPTHSTNPHPY